MNMHEALGVTGKLLISSPGVDNDIFDKSVILVLGHDRTGAIGVIVNRVTHSINMEDLCKELNFPSTRVPKNKIHFGGPLAMNTAVVLHSAAYSHETTIPISDHCNITSFGDVLEDFDKGIGPEESLFILGYARWDAGQLEEELKNNAWILEELKQDLLFTKTNPVTWEDALKLSSLGRFAYSPVSGNA
jgi:putative transcriptional regulator